MADSKSYVDLGQLNELLKTLLQFIRTLGWTKGVFAVFFFLMQGAVFWLYWGRLKDRQAEINRLALENREYRDHFMEVLKNHQEPQKKLPVKEKGVK